MFVHRHRIILDQAKIKFCATHTTSDNGEFLKRGTSPLIVYVLLKLGDHSIFPCPPFYKQQRGEQRRRGTQRAIRTG